MLVGPGALGSFMEALAVSEFTAMFGGPVGLRPMALWEVLGAVGRPLEGGALQRLYCGLLGYMLAQWVSGLCWFWCNCVAARRAAGSCGIAHGVQAMVQSSNAALTPRPQLGDNAALESSTVICTPCTMPPAPPTGCWGSG